MHYTALHERGQKLASRQQSVLSSDEVEKMLRTLEEVWERLNDSWDSRKQMLTQLYDLKVRVDRRLRCVNNNRQCIGSRQPIPMDPLPAVTMFRWHVVDGVDLW